MAAQHEEFLSIARRTPPSRLLLVDLYTVIITFHLLVSLRSVTVQGRGFKFDELFGHVVLIREVSGFSGGYTR